MTATPDAELQAALGASYTLERELGGGGMSRVFVADETELGRRVVVKLLHPELAAGVSAERFMREIRLAASLQQANIVPLLATGTASGLPYYTMPYVEGRSLRERLARDGALPVADATSVLRDVARALAYAHERGVVHRDIKPENILLSGGTAVVTDFGIAKAVQRARITAADGRPSTTTLTSVGTSLGTPAYMAPEQAAGDPKTDHRADIYSFGCLAYEVLVGKPPFSGSVHQLIAAHFSTVPPRVVAQRAGVPAPLDALVARCLEKDPARRPQSAADVLAVLDSPAMSAPKRPTRTTIIVASGVLAAAVITALALRPRVAHPGAAAPTVLSFAVVPCRNATGDSALEYRSDGMSDEILTSMAKLPGIRITGRTAAYRYKTRPDFDARAVERELGARLLLTCMLREESGRVTLSAQLNDSVAGGELAAYSFTRPRADLAGLAAAVVDTLAGEVRGRFGGAAGRSAPPGPGTSDPRALDRYLFGQALLKQRGPGVAKSVETFESAIAIDPNFARAHAALATALELLPYFAGTPPREVHDRAVNAAHRALALDSTLADAHVALGQALSFEGRDHEAIEELRRAVALEPDNAAARLTFGRILVLLNRPREAREQLERVRQLEHVSALVSAWLAYVNFVEGKRDSAMAESDRALQLDPTLLPVSNVAGLLGLAMGREDVVRRVAARVAPVGQMSNVAYFRARLGDQRGADSILDAMDRNDPRPWFTDPARACVALARGDTATALRLFERTEGAGMPWFGYIPLQDPAYDALRGTPRFAALLRRAGLDVALLTSPHGGRAR